MYCTEVVVPKVSTIMQRCTQQVYRRILFLGNVYYVFLSYYYTEYSYKIPRRLGTRTSKLHPKPMPLSYLPPLP
jgi:hypothetical protein